MPSSHTTPMPRTMSRSTSVPISIYCHTWPALMCATPPPSLEMDSKSAQQATRLPLQKKGVKQSHSKSKGEHTNYQTVDTACRCCTPTPPRMCFCSLTSQTCNPNEAEYAVDFFPNLSIHAQASLRMYWMGIVTCVCACAYAHDSPFLCFKMPAK